MATGNDELFEVLEQIDMESWLDREGVEYRVTRGSRGVQLNVKECPCCGSSSWKVYLNAETGLGNCFAGDCEKKYNRWSFIRASLPALSNKQVIDHLKEVAREQGWRPKRQAAAMAVNMKTDLVIPDSFPIPIAGRNLKYLERRNIDVRTAQYFGLRFSKRGVFRYQLDGKQLTQDYANRIIIPIFDLDGDLVSFQGRDITGTAEKKYLFPPGFASTGEHLYNGHNAHSAEEIVLGEGVFDVAAIKIAFDEVSAMRHIVPVGTFGKHLSEQQILKLLHLKGEGLKVVTFMWDGEDKAIDAALEAGLKLRRYGLTARIALLPKDRDPNEVAPSVVREAYWKALTINEATVVRLRLGRKAA